VAKLCPEQKLLKQGENCKELLRTAKNGKRLKNLGSCNPIKGQKLKLAEMVIHNPKINLRMFER